MEQSNYGELRDYNMYWLNISIDHSSQSQSICLFEWYREWNSKCSPGFSQKLLRSPVKHYSIFNWIVKLSSWPLPLFYHRYGCTELVSSGTKSVPWIKSYFTCQSTHIRSFPAPMIQEELHTRPHVTCPGARPRNNTTLYCSYAINHH